MFSKTVAVEQTVDLTAEQWEQLSVLSVSEWPEFVKNEARSVLASAVLRNQLMQQLPAMRKDWLVAKMKQLAEVERELFVGSVAPSRIPD